MKLRWILLVTTALLLTVALSPLHIANAFADVASYVLTCSSLSASGTADTPYVILWVEIDGEEFYQVVAVNNGAFSGTLAFPEVADGTNVPVQIWGALTADAEYENWDEDEYFKDLLPCVKMAESSTTTEIGPDIPASFTMRTIFCDTPVYDSPAGSLVGSAAVTAGQTFYAAPTDTIAADGSHWTQFFDGAWTYPYIPSVCVQ